jgi:hypothetical protein
MDAEYRERVNRDVDRIVAWYKLLIDTSNHVFIVENTSRRLRYCSHRAIKGLHLVKEQMR